MTVGRDGDGFWVEDPSGKRQANLAGPIRVNGTGDGAPLRNQSTSSGEPTPFVGRWRSRRRRRGRVALVNVLGLEEYLYGVVTKELPASFGPEPLKAQAVAARTYALFRRRSRPRTRPRAQMSATRSTARRSRRSTASSRPAALPSTPPERKVLLRGGAVFEPVYSSACGGHTESAPGSSALAERRRRRRCRRRDPGGADLSSDAGALSSSRAPGTVTAPARTSTAGATPGTPSSSRRWCRPASARFEGTQTIAASSTRRPRRPTGERHHPRAGPIPAGP